MLSAEKKREKARTKSDRGKISAGKIAPTTILIFSASLLLPQMGHTMTVIPRDVYLLGA
jgi:hypothetical protein